MSKEKIDLIEIGQEVIWLNEYGERLANVIEIKKRDKPLSINGFENDCSFIVTLETKDVIEHSFYLPSRAKVEFLSIQLNPEPQFTNIRWSGGISRGFIFSSREEFDKWKKHIVSTEIHKCNNVISRLKRDGIPHTHDVISILV